MTAYRASVKKPNELISGYVMFRINNVLLTLAQVARSQWTSQRVGGKLCGRCLDNPGRFKWAIRLPGNAFFRFVESRL